MKTILLLGLVLVALAPAQAQTFRPASFAGRSAGHGDFHGSRYRGGPWWGVGLYAPAVWGLYDYPAPAYYADYGYDAGYYAQPNYQATGTWLGALAGAIIGRNSGSLGHNAWRGAAYGAGLGYIFGTVAESNARARAATAGRPMGGQGAAQMAAPASSSQPVTIINNYYNAPATPMSPANSLFGR